MTLIEFNYPPHAPGGQNWWISSVIAAWPGHPLLSFRLLFSYGCANSVALEFTAAGSCRSLRHRPAGRGSAGEFDNSGCRSVPGSARLPAPVGNCEWSGKLG
jgi:hypothetical protein